MEDGFRGLQVAIVWDDPPDLIELQVRAGNGRFGGDIRAYAAPDAVHALADALDGFPRDSTDVREFSLGTFGPDTAGGAASFRFACTDRAGHAAVNLRLESGESPNQPETACFSFEFEPAALDRFVRELRELIPRREHAVLPAA